VGRGISYSPPSGAVTDYPNKIINLYNPEIIGTPTYVPALAAEILRIVRAEYEGVAHIAGNPSVSRLNFAREIASVFGYDPVVIMPKYEIFDSVARPKVAPRPQLAGLICDHDGYRHIDNHHYQWGLLELSKMKGIYNERSMERMGTGRSGSD
jgi:hypothetical protein